MRDYGRIFSSFWTSSNAQALSDDGRLLALYLLSCQHGTIAGVCRLPDGYVCEDMRWTPERVSKGFTELFANGFANRCETTKWVWVCKHFEWNRPENPNQWKAARKIATQVPDECSWKAKFLREFCLAEGADPADLENPYERVTPTVSKPVSVSEAVTVTENKKVPSEPVALERATDPPEPGPVEKVFQHWQEVHRKPRAKLDDKRRALIRKALKHYSEADLCQSISGYLNSPHHMGTDPKGNGTVYDDIELFLRDSKHVDAGLKFYAEPPRTDLSAQTRRNVAAISDWRPPEMREHDAAK